ncbi:sensor histidine kinase [Sediminicola luteus]|uniref:histidine kinase n=1 Tax=Sediminicola luteus TaxID=319238 RepID=A0A2A4G5T0_9FLAO|nr:HAMP domain-containing sensor histidine kinase [Sediminicola luteus]PCE63314.1 hypothetical protein B7P33_13935 [Sediminicola luteus]
MGLKQNHLRTLLIGLTIVLTLGIQLFWNYQQYKQQKQQLVLEVQEGLDNALEAYSAEIAKTDLMAFIGDDAIELPDIANHDVHIKRLKKMNMDSIFLNIEQEYDSMGIQIKGFTKILDSTDHGVTWMQPDRINSVRVFRGRAADSVSKLQGFANQIIVSLQRDSIDLKNLDSLLQCEFRRKDLEIQFMAVEYDNDSLLQSWRSDSTKTLALSTFSKSTFLPPHHDLELRFSNPTLEILKRSLSGILLSLILSICVIASLIYLHRTINKQKQLAEIKNDLISNITHEFKTPITTTAAAIEAIRHFKADPKSTDKYLGISEEQLSKLHQMVEKLLETATLDSDKLLLQKEPSDLNVLVEKSAQRFRSLASQKTIEYTLPESPIMAEIDPFHFENALGNLIDNALKYGGYNIQIRLKKDQGKVTLEVSDNGAGIDKEQRSKIFDKFYRIPTGNRHDVKGFGIGLYYTKSIIEKHGGQITLESRKGMTRFLITL